MVPLLLILTGISSTLHAEQITIAVASNFTSAMKSIVSEFQKETGDRVIIALGSSGKIYAQIKHGAPFQAFFSADKAKPIALEKEGYIVPHSRFTYAIGALALWSPLSGKIKSDANSLKQNTFKKIALANPRLAPYGVAAIQVLQHFHLETVTKNKWVLGENIAQTFQFVSSGNADLGLVALSQIMYQGQIHTGSAWVIPESFYQPIKQDAVLLKKGESSHAAHAFMQFMRSKKAHHIMAEYGYHIPNNHVQE